MLPGGLDDAASTWRLCLIATGYYLCIFTYWRWPSNEETTKRL